MKILHIVRNLEDRRALDTARAHSREHEVTLLLIQDAVLGYRDWEGPLYACREDLEARGVERGAQVVDYDDLVRLMFSHERVIMW